MIDFIMNNVLVLATDCSPILGEKLTNILINLFTWVQISIPVLAAVLCSVDIAQAVISQDEGAIKKAQSKCIKRLMIGVAIFFVPTILKILLKYSGMFGKLMGLCGIGG